VPASRRSPATPPPRFLRLAAHPLRWQLLGELARSDRRVGELCSLTGRRQSLVSYHLRALRDGGLVASRRSLADGRDTYYALDLPRCGEALVGAGQALHPGLAEPARFEPHDAGGVRLLFLCTGNSGRSPMAAALAEQFGDGTVRARSAGSAPKPAVHPHAVRAMRKRGIDIAGHRPEHVDELTGAFDVVVTLCDRVREVCPEFAGAPALAHWSLPDPAREADGYAAFERVAVELETRLPFLVQRIQEEVPA
jgi:ArsR family transcriptional regulator, arsenate/arsenite/antimonite-responsive transcriptional repressor / arsenate reductase (thioredoxin)